MAGPEQASERDSERVTASEPAPPGHFVSADHQSDCARFLQQVRELAERRAAAVA